MTYTSSPVLDGDVDDLLSGFQAAKPIPFGRRLYGMVRVSKVGKRDQPGETMLSVPEQKRVISECATTNGFEIVGWRMELDTSGGRVDRAVLEATLKDVADRKADGIICAYVSRYARTTDGIQAIRKLNAEGKTFIAVQEGIGPESLSTPAGWLLFTILVALAEFQLAILTEGFLSARRAHVEAGIANQVPYGYRKRPKTEAVDARHLEPDPLTSMHVEFIFHRRAAGASWPTIASELDANGVTPPAGGECWLWSRVRHIVQSRSYLGELHSGEYVNRRAHTAIVSAELWDAANKLNQAARAGKADQAGYPLTGIIRCATCGGRMVGFMQTVKAGKKRDGPPVKYRYYRCRKRYSWGRCPRPTNVPAGDLEAYAEAEFFRRFGKIKLVGHEAEDRSAQLAAAQAVIDEHNAAYDRFLASPQTQRTAQRKGQAWYDEQLERMNDDIEAAEAAWQEIRNEMTGMELPAGLLDEWSTLPVDEQRGFYSDAFGVVAVKPADTRGQPIADRVRVWARNEAGSPEDRLPRRGATIDDKVCAMVPIEF